MLFRRIVYDCRQATLLSIKKSEGKISPLDRLKLSYHLWYCGPCRQFIKQMAGLNKAGSLLKRQLFDRPPFQLDPDAATRIQQQIDELK